MDLRDQAWQCLDLGLLEGALFAAEQNSKLKPSDEARYLHGLCLFRLGRVKSAAHMLEGQQYLSSAYLFAQCCLQLERAEAGLKALAAAKPWVPTAQRGCPTVSALQLVSGQLHRALGDKESAVTLLATSARADPYLYENVSGLVELDGFLVDVAALFPEQEAQPPQQVPQSPSGMPRTPFVSRRVSRGLTTPLRAPSHNTPAAMPPPLVLHHDTPLQPPPNLRHLRNITPTPLKSPDTLTLAPRRRRQVTRRCIADDSFLCPGFDEPIASPASNPQQAANGSILGSNGQSSVGSAGGSAGHPLGSASTPRQIYMAFFEAYKCVCRYEFKQTLASLEKLPQQHQQTASVLALMARAYYEMLDYKRSVQTFENLRLVDPFRTADMEIYSSSLWQLKRQPELGFLAHEMTSSDREAWQTWCVMGNSYSCQQDGAKAIECFGRAVSLEPKCAVAWALQGHEHLLNEEYQTALDCFRTALKIDPKHYNAWLGMAMTFFRMEMYDPAEWNITMAARINPNNSVILCFAGLLAEKKDQGARALTLYKRASQLQPECLPARYQYGCHLMQTGQYEAAAAEFEWLRDRDPNDSDILFRLGSAYHQVNKRKLALECLTAAVSLDPKLGSEVKKILGGS